MRNKPNVQSALDGTRTAHDLHDVLMTEAADSTRYLVYAERAEQEGYAPAAAAFRHFAKEKKAHAALWMGYLGLLGTTDENLSDAANEAKYAGAAQYADASRNAAEEGFEELSDKARLAGNVVRRQTDALEQLQKELSCGTRYRGGADTIWKCENCGCTVKGNTPPDLCPLCGFSGRYFTKSDPGSALE